MIDLSSLRGRSFDLHTHTVFSDGENTPEEMVAAAWKKGLDLIGISDHSHTFFDESYCIAKARMQDYFEEIARLKQVYAGKIEVLCGIEQDLFSEEPEQSFDYTICSVHYLKLGGEYIPVDNGADVLSDAAKRYFGGDMYALVEEYFRTVGGIAEKNADIVGHFDYIQYHNDGGALFDQTHPRYRSAWRTAAEGLIESGKIFEVNVGGITRKGKTEAYPSGEICAYIAAHGGTLLYSGDCHAVSHLRKFPPFGGA